MLPVPHSFSEVGCDESLIGGHCSIDQKQLTLGTAPLHWHFGIDDGGVRVLRWTMYTHGLIPADESPPFCTISDSLRSHFRNIQITSRLAGLGIGYCLHGMFLVLHKTGALLRSILCFQFCVPD